MPKNDYIVEFRGITKTFPGIIANDDISLGIKKGEIYAILGENGAGKSTLMSMLFGMYSPDKGDILVRDEKVIISSPSDATKLSIGMVHQHFKLVENFSVTENIMLGIEPVKRFLGLPYVDIKGTDDHIRKLSIDYGLEVNPRDKVEDINVSTRQRVEILKMLYREAEILIFDEPTAMLTPQEIVFLLEIIKKLKQAGKTIILITHKLDEIKQVADRCAVLRRGKLICEMDAGTVSMQEMARQMVGREMTFSLNKSHADFGEIVLDVENLSVLNEFGFDVVKNANFKVHSGEVFAIAGVSGNGQVEIADAIAGLLPIKDGKISLFGENIANLSPRKRCEIGLSYIPEDRQETGLFLDFDLSTNLAMKSYYRPPFTKKSVLQRKAFIENADRLISEFDIRSGQGAITTVRSMSGGNQQKAIIAREIDLGSEFMIFVQPTRGLDVGAIHNIHKRVLEERDRGKAILLISLELDEVMACADTIGVIYNGEIAKIASASDISQTEIGEYMMGVKKNEE